MPEDSDRVLKKICSVLLLFYKPGPVTCITVTFYTTYFLNINGQHQCNKQINEYKHLNNNLEKGANVLSPKKAHLHH